MNSSSQQTERLAVNRISVTKRGLLLCALSLLVPGPARGASWEVDPVRVELSQKQQTSAITIRNISSESTTIQLKAVAWTQTGGKDVFTPTKELLISPPIVTIPANGEQIIRVALRKKSVGMNELTYRINLQELPAHPTPGFTGLQVALRIGVPVFVKPQKGKGLPQGAWVIARMSDARLKVGVQNHSNEHLQISDISLFVPGSTQAIAVESGSSYVLAGQAREWVLKSNSNESISGGRIQLKANTDAGDVDTELALGKP